MTRPGGMVSLIEFTQNLAWFDLVFGLLDGWWLFNDGRKHVLADRNRWQKSFTQAGFGDTLFTDANSAESRTLGVLTGFNTPVRSEPLPCLIAKSSKGMTVETVVYKTIGDLDLKADIYIPDDPRIEHANRPIGQS